MPSTSASNLSKIGKYKFAGCAGSAEGYPSFVELSSDPDMTTERCIALGSGKKYVGIFNRYDTLKKHKSTLNTLI